MGTVSLAHGGHQIIFLPFVLTLGVGLIYIAVVLRDGAKKARSVPVLPTSPLSRQVRLATRPKRPAQSAARSTTGRRPASSVGGRGGRSSTLRDVSRTRRTAGETSRLDGA